MKFHVKFFLALVLMVTTAGEYVGVTVPSGWEEQNCVFSLFSLSCVSSTAGDTASPPHWVKVLFGGKRWLTEGFVLWHVNTFLLRYSVLTFEVSFFCIFLRTEGLPDSIAERLNVLQKDYLEMRKQILAGTPLDDLKPLSVDTEKTTTMANYSPALVGQYLELFKIWNCVIHDICGRQVISCHFRCLRPI